MVSMLSVARRAPFSPAGVSRGATVGVAAPAASDGRPGGRYRGLSGGDLPVVVIELGLGAVGASLASVAARDVVGVARRAARGPWPVARGPWPVARGPWPVARAGVALAGAPDASFGICRR
jgi:hypothetical protein